MSEELNLLAFDLGASNGRAIIGKFKNNNIELQEVHRFSNDPVKVHNNLYWDVLSLLEEIKTGIYKAANKTNNNIDSLGIDTWGVDYAILNHKDKLLTNPYCYRDSRTDGLLDEVINKLSASKLYNQTGIQFMKINTLIQLYSDLKYRSEILDQAESLLFTPDLFNFFLTGEKYNEYTIASTSQLFNPTQKNWADELLRNLELPVDITEEIIYPGEKIGDLLPYIKKECEISGELPVMAIGSHDTASAVAATPLENRENSIYISSGTWSLLGMELNSPLINNSSREANFTNECGVGRKIRFLKNMSGLWLIQECKRIWNKKGKDLTYEQISQSANQAKEFKFLLDPNDSRFLSPQDMPKTVREYCKETNQSIPQNYAQLARGIYESLALSYRSVIENLEDLTNKKIKNINMVGGGIKAEILCQFTANATGKKVVTGPVEATAYGNILGQLMGHGKVNNLKEGRNIVRNSVSLTEYSPQNQNEWENAYRKYKKLFL